ncbi:hypothetical protein Tco_0424534 [Tanacetum coccineum]
MGDENPIRTLGDYSKPSHEGYKNTIELPVENNMDPNKHLKDFLKLVDSLDLDDENRERMRCSINTVTIHSEKQSDSYDEKVKENKEEEKDSPKNIYINPSTPADPSIAFITKKVLKFNSFFESLGLAQSSDTEVVCTKGDDKEVMFIELIRKNDDSSEGEPEEEGSTTTEGVGAEYFDIFPTRSELAYHKYLRELANK